MHPCSPAPPFDLIDSLSSALRTTPLMTRLHDPDHILADETARQLVENLEHLGIMVVMTAGIPIQLTG